MPNYIRAKFEGGYYFFTVVTYRRAELFRTELARRILREAIEKNTITPAVRDRCVLSFVRAFALHMEASRR